MRTLDLKQCFWLIVLAVGASLTALFIDESVFRFLKLKNEFKTNYLFFVGVGILLAMLAQTVIIYVSMHAAGSGIPQMRAIMAGVKLPGMLSFRTYLSKVFGMLFMLGSGMSLGKEGPFVHISGCIAESCKAHY